MLENIKLSFRGVWSHKMRSFLTMLGIIIGIAAIIAIVSTIQGTNKQIEKNLIGSGSNTVKVELQQDGYSIDLSYQELPAGIGQISDAAMEEIQKLDNVESASKYHSRNVYDGVYYQNTSLSGGYVYGIDSTYLGTNSMVVERGRGITDADMSSKRKVALVDEKAAKTLFQGEDCLGRTIEIQKEPYVIVGIVGEKEKYDLVINSIDDYYTYAGSDSSGNVYVPDATWPIIYQFDEPENLIVRASDTSTMTTVGKGAADILNGYISTSDDTIKYAAQDLLEQAKELQQLSASTNMMLIWIAGISLLVGGIGVMNIMLVSVTERTSEIGLKKAIGAGKGAILGQFLTEAVVLTSLGGLIGVIVGVILSKVISSLNGSPTTISPAAAVLAVLFSMAIGIIFGLLPSYKAANLNPIDALRHE